MNISVIVFDTFQDLDVFGPAAVLASISAYRLTYFSESGGLVKGSCGASVMTSPMKEIPDGGIVLVPGGFGTRTEVNNDAFIAALGKTCEMAAFVLTVCTGSALLAKTGLLDGKRATSNKRVFPWTGKESPKVNWVKKARWVRDGNIYTSSGVSAGMDMALAFVADVVGYDAAKRNGDEIEYFWSEDHGRDPFADLY